MYSDLNPHENMLHRIILSKEEMRKYDSNYKEEESANYPDGKPVHHLENHGRRRSYTVHLGNLRQGHRTWCHIQDGQYDIFQSATLHRDEVCHTRRCRQFRQSDHGSSGPDIHPDLDEQVETTTASWRPRSPKQ